jgi:hypothetical protein
MAQKTIWYDMPCGRCGTVLRAGSLGLWDRRGKYMTCIECPVEAATPLPDPPVIDAGVAGRSARNKHERLAAMRETKLKARWGDRAGGLLTKLTDEPQSTRAWATGAIGEEKLGAILDGLDGVLALHDRRIPGKRSNIDHIAFAPAGIFVIDTKHYAGQIEIRRKGSFFHPQDRLYVDRWDRTLDAAGVKTQAAVVESVLLAADLPTKPSVRPLLCFTRADWPLLGRPKSFDGVCLESHRSIKKLLIASSDVSHEDMHRARSALARALPPR